MALSKREWHGIIPRLIVIAKGDDPIKSIQATTLLRMRGIKQPKQETLEYRNLLAQTRRAL